LFSVFDVIAVPADTPCPGKHRNALKTKLDPEGSELSQSMGQLKMLTEDEAKNTLTVRTERTQLAGCFRTRNGA